MSRKETTLAFGLAFGVLGSAPAALAATLVVDDDGLARVNNCDAVDLADSTTIQGAIDIAMPGDRILVCPGIYVEDLTIFKDGLNLVGKDPKTTIVEGVATNAEGAFPEAVPNIDLQANGVQIHGFTIQSPPSVSGAYASGIVLDGADITIRGNTFKVSGGDPGSVAIQTWALANGSQRLQDISGLSIRRNTFTSLQLNNAFGYEAVFINPQLQPVDENNPVTVFHNEFSGDMYRAVGISRPSTHPKHNTMSTDLPITDVPVFGGLVPLGIKLFDGDQHVLVRNTMDDGGLGIFAAGLTVNPESTGNIVVNNEITADVGVSLKSDRNKVVNNKITADSTTGIELIDADDNKIVNNKIKCENGAMGIFVDADSESNKIVANRLEDCGAAGSGTAGGGNVIGTQGSRLLNPNQPAFASDLNDGEQQGAPAEEAAGAVRGRPEALPARGGGSHQGREGFVDAPQAGSTTGR